MANSTTAKTWRETDMVQRALVERIEQQYGPRVWDRVFADYALVNHSASSTRTPAPRSDSSIKGDIVQPTPVVTTTKYKL